MRKAVFGLLTGLVFTGMVCCGVSFGGNTIKNDHTHSASENLIVVGSVTQQTPEPARKNLVEVRKKRENHKYQEPPSNLKNQQKIQVKASAYCLRGLTSRGVSTRTGVIAVDPKVIPYGSRIYIPGYGWGTALDTGGSIRGNKIDIWMPTYNQCMQWGNRSITVTVVKP